MTDYLSRCPFCQAAFLINQEQMDATDGEVRCGKCMRVFSAPEYSTQLDADLASTEDLSPAPSNISDIAKHKDFRENQATVVDLSAFRQARHAAPEPVPVLPPEPPTEQTPEEPEFQDQNQDPQQVEDKPLTAILAGAVDTALDEALGDGLDNILEQSSERLSRSLTEDSAEDSDGNPYKSPDETETEPRPSEREEQNYSFHAEFVDDPGTSSTSGHWGFTSVNRIPFPPDIEYDESALASASSHSEKPSESSGFAHANGLGTLSSPVELTKTSSRVQDFRRFSMLPLALFLGVALVAQYVGYNFAGLQDHPRMRTLLTWWCVWSECAAPLRQDITALRSDQLVVRSHPRMAEALEVTFIFRNTAAFEQPFPLVELNFTDRENRLVANRVFTPEEYLPEPIQQYSSMPVNTPVQAELALVDPGAEAVNYNLVFRQP